MGGSASCLFVADPDGRGVQLMPYCPPATEVDRWPQHARPSTSVHLGGPRKLGHVNCLTAAIQDCTVFYRTSSACISDWLEDGGVWFHVNWTTTSWRSWTGLRPLPPPRLRDGGHREDARHARPRRPSRTLARMGPTRHGIAGNIASYVRIVEESLRRAVLRHGAAPGRPRARVYPDDRYSSNTWGPLPPRSYFRFDSEAIEYERQSLETLGHQLPPAK